MKKLNRAEIFCIAMPIVMGLLYFVGVFDLEYGYYVFLRIATLIFVGGFAITSMNHYDALLNYPTLASIALIILFNPFDPISFGKDTWVVFDIISSIIMFSCAGVMIYRLFYMNKED